MGNIFNGYYVGLDNGLSGAGIITKVQHPGVVTPAEGMPIPTVSYAFQKYQLADGNHLFSCGVRQWLAGQYLHWLSHDDGPSRFSESFRVVLEEPAKGQRGKKGQKGKTTADAIASTACSYGRLLAVLEEFNLPVLTVPPSTWQTRFWGKNGKWHHLAKEVKPSIPIVTGLWPDFDWRKSERGKKPYSGITDAYMLALFGCYYWDTEPEVRKAKDDKTRAAKKRARQRKKVAEKEKV